MAPKVSNQKNRVLYCVICLDLLGVVERKLREGCVDSLVACPIV